MSLGRKKTGTLHSVFQAGKHYNTSTAQLYANRTKKREATLKMFSTTINTETSREEEQEEAAQ